MEIFLVRHGQSQANAGLTDHLDSDLTETGRRQAALTAERLRGEGVTHVFVSPLRRTLQTTGFICAAVDRRAEITAEACEYFSAHYEGYKTFPGLPPEQISRDYPFAFIGDDFPCETKWWPQEPEDAAVIYARALRVRDALLARHAGTDARLVLVSHAETVGRLLEAFLRQPPNPAGPPWSNNCGVSQLRCPADPQAPAVAACVNDVSHLPDLVT